MVTKRPLNWSPGLILGAFCTIFRARPVGTGLGAKFGRKPAKNQNQNYNFYYIFSTRVRSHDASNKPAKPNRSEPSSICHQTGFVSAVVSGLCPSMEFPVDWKRRFLGLYGPFPSTDFGGSKRLLLPIPGPEVADCWGLDGPLSTAKHLGKGGGFATFSQVCCGAMGAVKSRKSTISGPETLLRTLTWVCLSLSLSLSGANFGCVLHHFSSPTRWNGSRGQVRPETGQKTK
jgi:hypothetical protein